MGLKEELQGIDGEQLVKVAGSVFDKLKLPISELEATIETTLDEYPAFLQLIDYMIGGYENKDNLNSGEKRMAIIGATAVLLTIREYVKVQEMQEQFPDISEA